MSDAATSDRARWRFLQRHRAAWAPWFALFALVVAVPTSQQIVQEVASMVGVDCAGDCTDDCEGSDCCPGVCVHCACCTSPSALPTNPAALPGAACASEATLTGSDEILATGYRSPPFRPPTA